MQNRRERPSRTIGVPVAISTVFERQVADIRRHTPLRQGLAELQNL